MPSLASGKVPGADGYIGCALQAMQVLTKGGRVGGISYICPYFQKALYHFEKAAIGRRIAEAYAPLCTLYLVLEYPRLNPAFTRPCVHVCLKAATCTSA